MAKRVVENTVTAKAVQCCLREVAGNARLVLHVVPKSKKERLECNENHQVILRVNAAPQDGKANARVLTILAAILETPVRSLELVRGQTSRVKEIQIEGMNSIICGERLLRRPSE
jgi:uncharacterized protein